MKKKVLFIVLEKIEALEDLLLELNRSGIKGATVINSTGSASTIASQEDDNTFSVLRNFFNPERDENKTIFTIIPENQISLAKEVVEKVVGDLKQPYTGIMFAFDVDFVEGIVE